MPMHEAGGIAPMARMFEASHISGTGAPEWAESGLWGRKVFLEDQFGLMVLEPLLARAKFEGAAPIICWSPKIVLLSTGTCNHPLAFHDFRLQILLSET